MFTKAARISRKFVDSNNFFHVYPSQGLSELLARAASHRVHFTERYRVLDLGPARQSVLELSAQESFDLQIVDIVSDLDIIDADPRSIYSQGIFSEDDWEDCLPAIDGKPVQALLCWDIFNYLGIEDIACLARCLARRCSPGSILHSLAYTSETMPLNPLQFDLLLPATLCRSKELDASVTPAPRYGLTLMRDSLGHFEAQQMHQLDADLQEDIYIYNVQTV